MATVEMATGVATGRVATVEANTEMKAVEMEVEIMGMGMAETEARVINASAPNVSH